MAIRASPGTPSSSSAILGDDADAKSFLQTQAGASGDIGTIAKAALYLMGDTTQKSAVQAGVQSSSVWVKVACAGALGIVDKDDASVNSAIIPEVKWIEPDTLGGTTDNGKGMYAAHILEIVAFDRRGWVFKGNAEGPVTFYGETAGGTGGTSGSVEPRAAGWHCRLRRRTSAPVALAGASGSGGVVASGGRSGSGGTTGAAGGSRWLGRIARSWRKHEQRRPGGWTARSRQAPEARSARVAVGATGLRGFIWPRRQHGRRNSWGQQRLQV